MELKEKANREAAETRLRMVAMLQVEQARAEMLAHPMRGNAFGEEQEPTEDFLNDENEPGNRETGIQDVWWGAGHFDLNSR
ncbi:hypothetical protein IFM89_013240 [Coptis chinensis]|uniref:Uncharacterized protein n=1 Tax=Coptis chinensis TaxID=261450 RepID=A0A835M619_9MAGN|nr:hypothetical protein IFM89_013240 [Coptis chinensis]